MLQAPHCAQANLQLFDALLLIIRADRPGSGLHLHLSLTDNDGNAVMADKADSHGLSTAGRQIAAGLLTHSAALAAFHAPSVNSYKRLVIGRSLSAPRGHLLTLAGATTIAPQYCAQSQIAWSFA